MDNGFVIKINSYTSSCKSIGTSQLFLKDKIIKAKLIKSGYIALTKEAKYYVIKSITKPLAELFFDLKRVKSSFEAVAVVDFFLFLPIDSASGQYELLFCMNNYAGIFKIKETKKEVSVIKKLKSKREIEKEENDRIIYIENGKMTFSNKTVIYDIGIIDAIALSPSNDIAIFKKITKKSSSSLLIFNSSLVMNNSLSFSFNTHNNDNQSELYECLTYPKYSSFCWCGNDAVSLCSNRYITLLSLSNNTFRFQIISKPKMNEVRMYCIPEIDGTRVLSPDGIIFISKVSDSIYNSCCLKTEESSSKQLITYYQKILDNQIKCDQVIKQLHKIPEALNEIYHTALFTLNNTFQSLLLKVVSFSKIFLIDKKIDTKVFFQQSVDIKILNLLREKDRLITYNQYKYLSIKRIIDLLLYSKDYLFAETIAKESKYETKKIHQKWAYMQIKSMKKGNTSIQEENACFSMIYAKLKYIPNISYVKLYHKAKKHNKHHLSMRFIQYDQSISAVLPIYIENKEWDRVMRLAKESNDKYTIYSSCDKIFRSIGANGFFAILQKINESETMGLEYLERFQENHYINFLTQNAHYQRLFFYYLKKYFKASLLKDRNVILIKLKDLLIVCKNVEGFDINFYTLYIENIDQSQKIRMEVYSENPMKWKKDKRAYDNSILDVYGEMINRKGAGYRLVENINRDFKVSQRIISIMRVRYYSETNVIEGIDTLIKYNFKESNLSFLDIGEALFDYQKKDLSLKVIEMLKQDRNVEYFCHKIELIIEMK